ncbi:hypothetical protein OSB04_023635 [Centaurea solstitialis]|uniref:Retrotransposon gag domain-containing protein n=1 Tax=Centaurea solstitialis TaxID=347529 RepID=A0AA38SK98_9ASTR|nr:hypothetical protein OSB04_023635 [Centaurea solstitialis]
MLYGKACHLPFEFEYKALWALKKVHLDDIASGRERLISLHELEELRSLAYENSKIYKEQRKKWHDAHLKEVKLFKEGDKVLMYQTRFKFPPGKLKSRWIGPYVVLKAYPSGYVDLMTERGSFKVNGHRLKLYNENDPVRNGERASSSRNVQDHPCLSFDSDNILRSEKMSLMIELDRLKKREVEIGLIVDLHFVEEIGFGDRLSSLLRREYRDHFGVLRFVSNDWEKALKTHEPIYYELVLEFLATFSFDVEAYEEDRIDGPCIRFCLLMSRSEYFSHYFLTGACEPSAEFVGADFWATIGSGPYLQSNNKESSITLPEHRLLYRMLVHSFAYRRAIKEKVPEGDLWLLSRLVNRNAITNLSYVMAKMFQNAGKVHDKAGTGLCGGHFITVIAEKLGSLTPDVCETLTKLSPMGFLDKVLFRSMKLLAPGPRRGTFVWIGDATPNEEPVGMATSPPQPTLLGQSSNPPPANQQGSGSLHEAIQGLSEQMGAKHHEMMERLDRVSYDMYGVRRELSWVAASMSEYFESVGHAPSAPLEPHPVWRDSDAGPTGYSTYDEWAFENLTTDLLEPFEYPEREFRKRNKKKSKANKVRPRALIFEMGDEAPMWTARRAAPTVPTNPITKPNLNKEISGKLLHMIKDLTFDGKNDSNPIADWDDAIRLRVFPLTLTGEARAWLRSLEPSSITTWEGLRSKFLSRFFPPSKIDKLRAEIRSFQQQDGETISEAWERFKHLLNSCLSHELNKSEQVQIFYSGLAYSSRATLDSSAGGVFMYKTPTEGYKLLEDMLIHNIDWRTDKRLQIPRMAGKISTDFDPSDELAAMKNQQVKFERKIEELIKSVHALQVGCEECSGPHLTKDCPNKPMMTPEEVNYINRGDYQGRWNNNRNFIPRPPGFFAPNQQNQRPDGEPRVSIEDRIIQFMDAQKKLNDEVGSYLRNHQSTIQNLESQVGRVSQMLSERTQGELPTQTQVNPKVENVKPMLMMTGEPSKKKWTDIYTKKYVETESESEPDYAMDYDSEGFTVSFEHLRLKVPEASSDDEEEDGKQGGYAEFVIPKKEDKGKEKEKEKAPEDDLIYIAPIKHDPGSYNLPISCHRFKGLALVDSGAALNMMPFGYCRKMGVKKIIPTDYQYRGVNGYMTKPLGIAEGVPIRIGNFVYYTDFVIANLPQNTEIPIILGRSFLHTAQVNTDIRNQVTSLGYGDNRIYFDPNGEPVRHLDEPYEDSSLAYNKSTNRPLLPHEHGKKTEDYPNPMHQKDQKLNELGSSKKDHRKKKGSSARRARK